MGIWWPPYAIDELNSSLIRTRAAPPGLPYSMKVSNQQHCDCVLKLLHVPSSASVLLNVTALVFAACMHARVHFTRANCVRTCHPYQDAPSVKTHSKGYTSGDEISWGHIKASHTPGWTVKEHQRDGVMLFSPLPPLVPSSWIRGSSDYVFGLGRCLDKHT